MQAPEHVIALVKRPAAEFMPFPVLLNKRVQKAFHVCRIVRECGDGLNRSVPPASFVFLSFRPSRSRKALQSPICVSWQLPAEGGCGQVDEPRVYFQTKKSSLRLECVTRLVSVFQIDDRQAAVYQGDDSVGILIAVRDIRSSMGMAAIIDSRIFPFFELWAAVESGDSTPRLFNRVAMMIL